MHEQIKYHYGKTIQSVDDLKTSACCDTRSRTIRYKPIRQHFTNLFRNDIVLTKSKQDHYYFLTMRIQSEQIPISRYTPGRFAYLMNQPFVPEIWALLASKENISLMINATQDGKPAIFPLLREIESRFEGPLSSPDFPPEDVGVLVNNMILQIMKLHGYEHLACGICREAKWIKSSGVYKATTEASGSVPAPAS
jgi:hypothetical protein